MDQQIIKIFEELKIPLDLPEKRNLIFYPEATELKELPCDLDQRAMRLTPTARIAFLAMKAAAAESGIELLLYSSFRDFEYQKKLIQKRLDQGEELDQILTYLAPPGYSEHHSGRAIDITTQGVLPGSVEFENSPAFEWLFQNSSMFNYEMSYPIKNPWGFIYEPWHWAFQV